MSDTAPNLNAVLDALSLEVAELQSATAQVNFVRQLANAQGRQLEILGAWVGLPRTDVDDAVYRAAVAVQWYENNSSGLGDEVAYIAQQLCGATSVACRDCDDSGNYYLQVTGGSIADPATAQLQALSAGGVQLAGLLRNWPLVPFACGDACNEGLLHE